MVRELELSDIGELKRIHRRFFSREFPFADLFGNSLSSYVVTSGDDKIIVGGQVRQILEVRIVTDKDVKVVERRKALLEMLGACMQTTASKGFDELHAFVQDENWMRHLEDIGFRKTKGQALVLHV